MRYPVMAKPVWKGQLRLHLSISLGSVFFAAFAWALWRNRNKMAIEQKFSSSSTSIIFVGISFLQRWKALLKPDDQLKVDGTIDKMMNWLKNFSTSAGMVSDIVEL
ncbi:unnamed protein product [Urochloa humidicola]